MSARNKAKLPTASAIKCPDCGCDLTEIQIRSILGQFGRSKRLGLIRGNRFASMTPQQRSAEARKASHALCAKRAARPAVTPAQGL
jgi:hypothetical protein